MYNYAQLEIYNLYHLQMNKGEEKNISSICSFASSKLISRICVVVCFIAFKLFVYYIRKVNRFYFYSQVVCVFFTQNIFINKID